MLLVFLLSAFSITAKAENKQLLWISEKQDEKLDLIYRGFSFANKEPLKITFVDSNSRNSIYSQINYSTYDYVIASGDTSWQFVESLESNAIKIGIGVTQASINQYGKTLGAGEYLITKEQAAARVFALIESLDLNHAQASALFYKEQVAQRTSFIEQAKVQQLPFKPIFLEKTSSTLEVINSIHDCCRIFYLKQQDLQAQPQKHASLFYESYRRKIISVGNREEMLAQGAMYVIFTPDYKLGEQAADLILNIKIEQPMPNIQYPADFVIDSNDKIKSVIDVNLTKKTIGELTKAIKLAEQLIE